MPIIYLSPSTQERNYYVTGGTEEQYMNQLADLMVPYLDASGIRYTRNTPSMTAASSIAASNSGNYDLHLAWGARDILESAGINPETINLQDIESRYEKLCADRMATSDAYKKAERECEKLKQSRDALLTFIGQEPSQDIDRDKKIIR